MKALLKIAALLGLGATVAHGQSLPSCPTSGAITQSCTIAPGAYPLKSSLTISQSNILVQCQPGATLVQSSGTPIFDVEGTVANPVSNVTIDGCSLDMNNSPTGTGTVKVYATNRFTFRNSTIKNIPESSAGIWLVSTSNSTVKENTMLGPSIGVLSYGPEDSLHILDNRVIGGIFIQSTNDGGTTTSFVVTGNILSPDPNGSRTCATIQDASQSKTAPITNFTFSHNTCRIRGTDSSHPAFGAYSFMTGNSGVCSVSDNVVDASGEYIGFSLWEIGVTNCTFSGNLTLGGNDTHSQTYHGWVIFGGNNTFTGNTTIGWGANGGGMVFYQRDQNEPLPPAHGDNTVVTGGTLLANSPSGQLGNNGLWIMCNSADSSINNMKITGMLISGALNRGINVEGDYTSACPVSVMLDSITISGALTGLETSNATIGVQNLYTLGVGTRWTQLPLTTVITPQ